ncbi:MAG TPA: hypothetical protein VIN09_09625, partial [Chloroflexota bacterium]
LHGNTLRIREAIVSRRYSVQQVVVRMPQRGSPHVELAALRRRSYRAVGSASLVGRVGAARFWRVTGVGGRRR